MTSGVSLQPLKHPVNESQTSIREMSPFSALLEKLSRLVIANERVTSDGEFQTAFGTSPPTTQYFPSTAEPALSMNLASSNLPDPQSSQLSLIAASANEMVTQDGTGPLDVVDVRCS